MSKSTSDLRIGAVKPLLPPEHFMRDFPTNDDHAAVVAEGRAQIQSILSGADDRLLVIVGPCSIHDPAAAMDFAGRLRNAAHTWSSELLLCMRLYFEKPRTTIGWKGLINDPRRDSSFEVNEGLGLARKLLRDITELGLPAATEFLDTTLGQYYSDLISWGAIGARTVESQVHRALASGLSMPVGFKNRTDGNIQVALDAIESAHQGHCFPTLTFAGHPALYHSTGNEFGHLILRGGSDGPNYDAESVQSAVSALAQRGLTPRLVVDCSHANSGKKPERQQEVVRDLAARISAGEAGIAGLMMESFLVEGAQDPAGRSLRFGQSITDPCLSWEDTESLLAELGHAVQSRRSSARA